MLKGEFYNPDDKLLIQKRKKVKKILKIFNDSLEKEKNKRAKSLIKMFKNIGEKVHIEPPFYCDYGKNISVGHNFYANTNCVMLDVNEIKIGNNCFVGPGVHFYTVNHPINPVERNTGREYAKSIKIGENVWIGGRSVINPGIEIGDNVVVASGSIITKNIPDSVMVAGNPAKIIKHKIDR